MLEITLPTHEWPAPVDFTPNRAAFRAAIAKGADGRDEYVTWREAYNAARDAIAATAKAYADDHATATATAARLAAEGKRLEALAHHTGRAIASADRSEIVYTAEAHQSALDTWRRELTEYDNGHDHTTTAPSFLAVPLVPYPKPGRFIDATDEPRPYSLEHDAAMDVALST